MDLKFRASTAARLMNSDGSTYALHGRGLAEIPAKYAIMQDKKIRQEKKICGTMIRKSN